MLVVRQVFQAKYGRGDELVAMFKEMTPTFPKEWSPRLMTDASGRFFTVVTEFTVKDFAEWEQVFQQMMSGSEDSPEDRAATDRMNELVESGSREFYTVVE